MTKNLAILVGGLFCIVAPLSAHHSVTGEYDPEKKVTLKGTVSRIEWTNPHARIYVDVTGADGKATTWNCEMAARSSLTRQGWTGRTVKVGDTVTIEGDAARSGIPGLHTRSVYLADGTKVLSGAN